MASHLKWKFLEKKSLKSPFYNLIERVGVLA